MNTLNDADKSDARYSCLEAVLDLAECTNAGLVFNTQGYHGDTE